MIKHAIVLTMLATPVAAQNNVTGTVEHFYYTYTEEVPETKRVCETVQVPIYKEVNKGASGADVFGGLLIGGILGKALTGDDKGAAAGAVIGGIASAERNKTKQVITGYQDVRECSNQTYIRDYQRKEYDYSALTFNLDGKTYTVTFER
jgi:uncharacterized protein YcfJ